MPIPFVRVQRCKRMKRGVAYDKAGKRWRGFETDRRDDIIRLTGLLGSVGLCWCCGTRVYAGWESLDDRPRRDLCDSCVILPSKIFVVENKDWESVVREFLR